MDHILFIHSSLVAAWLLPLSASPLCLRGVIHLWGPQEIQRIPRPLASGSSPSPASGKVQMQGKVSRSAKAVEYGTSPKTCREVVDGWLCRMDGLGEFVLKRGFQSQVAQAQILALSLATHVALGELLHLCKLQSPHLQNRDQSTFLTELLGGLNEKM